MQMVKPSGTICDTRFINRKFPAAPEIRKDRTEAVIKF